MEETETVWQSETTPDDTTAETTGISTDTAAQAETETAITETESETVTEPETETETETETEPETETETEPETETEAQTTSLPVTTVKNGMFSPLYEPEVIPYRTAYKDADFMEYISALYGDSVKDAITAAISDGTYQNELLFTLTGKSVYVLYDEYAGLASGKYRIMQAEDESVINIGFCGDIMLGDNEAVMNRYNNSGYNIEALISPDLLRIMRGFDILAANNEFAASNRGKRVPKMFNYRGKPENLSLYQKMGVDFVSTANNHIYDYGLDAFLDTLDALEVYGIDNAGAGKNINEAASPFYYVINGRKIAIICGSRAEKNYVTPIAEENVPGVFGMYDEENMIKAVSKAEAEADFVIVFAHWGAENSSKTENIIRAQGHKYIDAGADLIVGVHAHQLQEIEIYRGKVIAYNLGNFLFENPNVMTGILQIRIDPAELSYSAYFIACIQNRDNVYLCEGDERSRVLEYLRSISSADIDGDGKIK